MRVLIVNTSELTGGAAIAAGRLCKALNDHGVKAKMLVRDKQTDRVTVAKAPCSKWHFLWERLCVLVSNGFSMEKLWQADIANSGVDITRLDEFQEADVIHLHWINQGFLSLRSIEKILQSGKRVVWTLHDEWPYLGVCHYRGDCKQMDCRQCPVMPGSMPHRLLQRKMELIRQGHIRFVGCSQWITDQAKKAMPGEDVRHINNALDTTQFCPQSQREARLQLHLPTDCKLVLFVSQKVTDERKGVRYMMEALDVLKAHGREDIRVVVVGKHAASLQHPMLLQLGSIPSSQMASLYAAVDVFATPSLQDNLPNTIVESMACGTPCVGFRVGGIPEMIDHLKDGYLANYCDAQDLAQGIEYVLAHPEMREAARHHAVQKYGEDHIAAQYKKVYEE